MKGEITPPTIPAIIVLIIAFKVGVKIEFTYLIKRDIVFSAMKLTTIPIPKTNQIAITIFLKFRGIKTNVANAIQTIPKTISKGFMFVSC